MSLNPDLLRQVHLSGESGCTKFQPHPMKANFCIGCSKLFNKHSPDSIANDDMLIAAIEYSQKGQQEASCIICGDPIGGLFLGGFGAVGNQSFLKTNKITHVLNTARGLEIFGPKYPQAVARAESEQGITFLQLKWDDATTFSIPEEDLVQAVKFIHRGRLGGGSVLVHCAQGKSRSATAVVAYLMVAQNKSCTEALATVQSARKMAEPNPKFLQTLRQFEGSLLIQSLRSELCSQ